MNYTIFYSWQSDLENKFNRSFIQYALEKAVKAVSNDKNFTLEAVIDRDTYGIPGSPSIVESITGKIAKSDVFVCDISIINSISTSRQVPNPNVLYELGFASAILGWERIIMIQNSAFGGPDKLPFDLRGRRILQYHLNETTENKSDETKKLKNSLVKVFTEALNYYGNEYNTKEKITWWGKWSLNTKAKVRGGQLQISKVSSDAFIFELRIYDGARTGEVAGKAQILTPHFAHARIDTYDNLMCELIFRRRLEGGLWYIDIEEGFNCSFFHGHNAYFSGSYQHHTEQLVNRGYLDEIDLNEIQRLTGKYLSVFLENFQLISYEKQNEDQLRVITGAVKGLYTIMRSIIVLDNVGTIWCACLDPEANVVRYFSNTTATSEIKPKAITEWLSEFYDRTVVVNNSGDV